MKKKKNIKKYIILDLRLRHLYQFFFSNYHRPYLSIYNRSGYLFFKDLSLKSVNFCKPRHTIEKNEINEECNGTKKSL